MVLSQAMHAGCIMNPLASLISHASTMADITDEAAHADAAASQHNAGTTLRESDNLLLRSDEWTFSWRASEPS